jgi:hypothetical protein
MVWGGHSCPPQLIFLDTQDPVCDGQAPPRTPGQAGREPKSKAADRSVRPTRAAPDPAIPLDSPIPYDNE